MSKNFEIELSEDGFKDFAKALDKIGKKLDSDDFNKFLMGKCRDTLEYIMHNENIEEVQRGGEYIEGNHEESGKNYIRLYNDSEIDIESQDTWLNDYGKMFYPSTLSLAQLIEYGAGLIGARSSKNTGDEWDYMVNENRNNGNLRSYEEGWEWNNQSYSNFPSVTQGQEGKYIYYQLYEEVLKHIDEWVSEYVERLIGGSV